MPVVNRLEIPLFGKVRKDFAVIDADPGSFFSDVIPEGRQVGQDVVTFPPRKLGGEIVRPGTDCQWIGKLVLEEIVHSAPSFFVHPVLKPVEIDLDQLAAMLRMKLIAGYGRDHVDGNVSLAGDLPFYPSAPCLGEQPYLAGPGNHLNGAVAYLRTVDASGLHGLLLELEAATAALEHRHGVKLVRIVTVAFPPYGVVVQSCTHPPPGTFRREGVPYLPPFVAEYFRTSRFRPSEETMAILVFKGVDRRGGVDVTDGKAIRGARREYLEFFDQTVHPQGISVPPEKGYVSVALGRIAEFPAKVDP